MQRLAETVQERDRVQSAAKQSEIEANEAKRAVALSRIELDELKRYEERRMPSTYYLIYWGLTDDTLSFAELQMLRG